MQHEVLTSFMLVQQKTEWCWIRRKWV